LTHGEEGVIKLWAADDRLWTTQETVEHNLRIFARLMLRDRPEPINAPTKNSPQPIAESAEPLKADPRLEPCRHSLDYRNCAECDEPLKADPWASLKSYEPAYSFDGWKNPPDIVMMEGGDGPFYYLAAEVDAAHAAALAKHAAEVGAAYWRGFQQATYNKPGCLTTADELIAAQKEHAADTATIADLRAELDGWRKRFGLRTSQGWQSSKDAAALHTRTWEKSGKQSKAWKDRAEAAEAALTTARQALEGLKAYAGHYPFCESDGESKACTCGLAALLPPEQP
jgi:hypothetical protein